MNADDSNWAGPAEIVEVKNEIVTLFSPAGFSSSSASATYVQSDKIEIVEGSGGLLTLKILERYGTPQNLGQISQWEERETPRAAPHFPKGPNVFNIEFSKPGSAERRRMDVFESLDGQNSYMLEFSTGETLYGDNVAISRDFLLSRLDLETQGFRQTGLFAGASKFSLYINPRT